MPAHKNDPHRPNPYASGGFSKPIDEITAGHKYRVRDEKTGRIWLSTGASWNEAHRLKESLAGQRIATTLVVEDVTIPVPVPGAPTAAPPPVHADEVQRAFAAGLAAGRAEQAPAPVPAHLPHAPTATPAPPPVPSNGTADLDVTEALANDALDDDSLEMQ